MHWVEPFILVISYTEKNNDSLSIGLVVLKTQNANQEICEALVINCPQYLLVCSREGLKNELQRYFVEYVPSWYVSEITCTYLNT